MGKIPDAAIARFFDEAYFGSDYERYAALVLSRAPNVSSRRLDPDEIGATAHALRERGAELEALGGFRAPVFRNVEALGERLGLDATERAIVAFTVIATGVEYLRDAVNVPSESLHD